MRLIFSDHAWEDYQYFQTQDKKTLKHINLFIKEIQRTSFEGVGKPEQLKHAPSGYRSRRINQELRIVYKVHNNDLLIAQLRHHD